MLDEAPVSLAEVGAEVAAAMAALSAVASVLATRAPPGDAAGTRAAGVALPAPLCAIGVAAAGGNPASFGGVATGPKSAADWLPALFGTKSAAAMPGTMAAVCGGSRP